MEGNGGLPCQRTQPAEVGEIAEDCQDFYAEDNKEDAVYGRDAHLEDLR